ncbi:MAG TPA: SgcJ/EcaC family oxidoreductase [Rhizomicrobium sp.]|nr:SgcJ/EcaC family oxidoreductase [Rhizomicrobium sp.]
MRYFAVRALLLILCSFTLPLPAFANAADDVRAVVNRVEDGYDKYDAKQVASVYTADAIWQNPFGVRLQGRDQIEKFLTKLFQRPGYRSGKSTSKLTMEIHFVTPDVAVAWSEEASAGQIDDSTGKPIGQRKSHYMEVLVRKPGGWFITDDMIMDEK